MKKLFTLCLAISMASVAFAQVDNLEELLEQKAKAAPFVNAINSVIEVSFDVKTDFNDEDILNKNPNLSQEDFNWGSENDPYKINLFNVKRKGCSMFLIDQNWLIGSVECIGSETHGAVGNQNLKNIPYKIDSKRVLGDLTFDFYQDKKISAKGHFFKGEKMVLVYIGGTKIKKDMANKPVAKILFFETNIFTLCPKEGACHGFKLRTKRFDSGSVKARSLKANSYEKGYFALEERVFDLSGTGGDPLFYEAPLGIQYLVGFNAGKIIPSVPDSAAYESGAYYGGEITNNYYDFHLKDYEFIKKTISSKSIEDWERIEKNLEIRRKK